MSAVPRVNIELPPDLHKKAKAVAALKGSSLKDFIIEAVDVAVKKGGRSGVVW